MLIKKVIFLGFLFACFTSCGKFRHIDTPDAEAKQLTNCGEIWYHSFLGDFCGIPSEKYSENEGNRNCSLIFNDIAGSWSYNDFLQIRLFESSSIDVAENFYMNVRDYASTNPNFKPLLDLGAGSFSIYTPNDSYIATMELRFLKGAVDGYIHVSDMDCFTENDVYVLARRIADNIPEF